MSTQITPSQVKSLLHQPHVKLIDASWALDGSDMKAAYDKEHIKGAVFFDIDAISDKSSPLPHMAPSLKAFETAMNEMGISNEDLVVIYDRQGLFSAARVWWTFTLMGHEKVKILHGGLPAWLQSGYEVTSEPTITTHTPYRAQFQPQYLADKSMVAQALGQALILDARPKARFEGAKS